MSYSHEWDAHHIFYIDPVPWGPGEGTKGQISFNFNYKVNFKDFYSKLCVCSHKWPVQNILDEFFILSPGSCRRGGTLGYLGAKIKFRPPVCLLCYLLLNHWIKFNPNLVCELLTWMDRSHFFLARPLGPWRWVFSIYICRSHARIQKGERGPLPPSPEKSQKYRFS